MARRNLLRIHALLLLPALAPMASGLRAADWPQYRGPNHDGTSTETIRTNWSETPPRQIWKVPLDPALSSFAIAGGKAFTQVRRRLGSSDQEFCIALNAETGQELWATPLGKADYPHGGVGPDDGPRSTPSVDGDRVYVLTSYLRIACMDATTGQQVWSRDLVADYGGNVIAWQNAASPLIVGDLIFMNCNGPNQRLLALRKQDGSEAWKAQNDPMTQSTPVAANIAGVAQVIFFAQSGLVSVAPETGTLLWRYPFPYSVSTAASPVVGDDVVYCSAAYGMGAGAVRISGTASALVATEVWRTPGANMNHWATPVHHDGYLYGIYGQSSTSLRCIELATGTQQWLQAGVGYGSVLFVNGYVLMLTEPGDLVLVNPDPSAYTEVDRFKAVAGKCWNVPAISNGRIYVRSTTEAACLDVAPKALPALKLLPSLAADKGGLRLLIVNEDASPVDANRVTNIDVFATFDLAVGSSNWTRLAQPYVLTNGQLRLDDPTGLNAPQRFFRAAERR